MMVSEMNCTVLWPVDDSFFELSCTVLWPIDDGFGCLYGSLLLVLNIDTAFHLAYR